MAGTRHRSGLRRLAVLPAAALAAVAFAAPARAEDEPPPLASPEVVAVDRSVAGLVVAVSHDGPMPPAPTHVVAEADESPVGTQPTVTAESPANGQSDGWILVEPVRRSRPQAAVVSRPDWTLAVARAPTATATVRQAAPAENKRQYQPLRTQYQQVAVAVPRVRTAASHRKVQASGLASSSAWIRVGITAPNGETNCSEERNLDAPICPEDAAEKLPWECSWIPECARDGSPAETPFDGSGCDDLETQYQPDDEQYQSEGEDPESESSDEEWIEAGENEPASRSCDDDDADDSSDVGSPSVEPPSGPDPGIGQPVQPTAPELPSTAGPGVGPQGLTGAEPSGPPLGEVPVDESPAAGTAQPQESSSKPRQPPTMVRKAVGRVLGVLSTKHDARPRPGLRSQPTRSRPREQPAKARPTLSRPRVEVIASHERTSGGGSTAGPGVWLLMSAMLLFAGALLRLAYSGLDASPGRIPIGTLGSRLRSRGLSRSSTAGTPADRGGEEPTGIRYRD